MKKFKYSYLKNLLPLYHPFPNKMLTPAPKGKGGQFLQVPCKDHEREDAD
jgi:hypothetical protein